MGFRRLLSVGVLTAGAAAISVPAGSPARGRASCPASARTAPIKVAEVPWGKVGYRSVGSGPPLLLLAGGGQPAPSIDDWPPALIDALACTHRVLAMDYEGVGRSSARSGNVSITRLADDTAAFIGALKLGRTDVLGWSMGGFVAQSLAIRHPAVVRRLVLCSSALGDGTARGPSASGRPAYPAQWLFPFNSRNRARARAFERAVHSYPHYYEGGSSISQQEGIAIFLWEQGSVPEGHRADRITAPALVGGGSQDVILPLPDSRRLARELKHSTLHLFPDAGHGFLVQDTDMAAWITQVNRFLPG